MDTVEKMEEALNLILQADSLINAGLKENESLRKAWGYTLNIISAQLFTRSPLSSESDGFARVLKDVIADEGKSWHKKIQVDQSENLSDQQRQGRKLR